MLNVSTHNKVRQTDLRLRSPFVQKKRTKNASNLRPLRTALNDMKPEIVAYARERYIEEHQRFDHIENKCGRIMGFTTVLITTITALLSFFSTSLFQPKGPLDVMILVVTVISVFVLICSWGHALLSIKLGAVNVAPRKEANFNYMQEKTDIEMHQHMINCYLDPLKN